MNYLAAWKPQALTPVAPLPSLLANCCKARGFKPRVRNVRRLQLLFFLLINEVTEPRHALRRVRTHVETNAAPRGVDSTPVAATLPKPVANG